MLEAVSKHPVNPEDCNNQTISTGNGITSAQYHAQHYDKILAGTKPPLSTYTLHREINGKGGILHVKAPGISSDVTFFDAAGEFIRIAA